MFVIVIFYFFIVSIRGDFTIVRRIPNTTISSTTNQFTIEINQAVNRPQFQSFIHFYNATTNMSIDQIDVYLNTSNVNYSTNTLIFYLPDSIKLNISGEFYITFDQGVLFSNATLNSTAQNDSSFWHLVVVNSETSTTPLEYTSMGTTYNLTTGSSMSYSDTSTGIMTTIITTYDSINQTTTTSLNITTISESPPTRSAQLGMGIGITFITIIIIGEILYFKYCHDGNGRSGSYFT
ncbi:unnamed protein product [Rotaria sp. Silwood1]|nr:unnamed protein product [Rotaria sp. Silwood1]CAF1279834.1 unnamed protein product [Rotaria sp. Silwood1]CAF3496416.1 unnamed protein product [Rotaria sp. Silwood1]CAF4681732.1 unnamed protein product [Rotaria sp. Silwood1]